MENRTCDDVHTVAFGQSSLASANCRTAPRPCRTGAPRPSRGPTGSAVGCTKSPPYTWIAPVRWSFGIRHGVHRVVAEHRDVASDEFLAARLDEPVGAVADAPVERVVLLAGVDADRGPHPVIVREDPHARRPDDVQHREVGCAVQHGEAADLRLRARRSRRRDRRSARCSTSLIAPAGLGLRDCGTTVGEEGIEVEHAPGSRRANGRGKR